MKSGSALAVCQRYLDRLPLSFELRQKLLRHVAERDAADPPRALSELHRVLAGNDVEQETPCCASVARRLELAYGNGLGSSFRDRCPDTSPLAAAPPIERTPMAPHAWPPRPLQ